MPGEPKIAQNAAVTSDKMAEDTPMPGATARYSLDRPLPPDVVFRSAGWFSSYRNFPAFSATWFWRRTALFAPAATLLALAQCVMVWRLVDGKTWAVFTAVCVLIWVVIVTAGPALATIVRHDRLQPRRERVMIVAAIVTGVAISFGAQYGANALTTRYLMPRAYELGTVPRPKEPHPPFTAGVIVAIAAWQGMLFLSLGGGFALISYMNEQKRWQELQRERDLERLRVQKSEVDLKLTVLQAQVEPHFLFNTLASVHSLIRKDPQRAEATVEALVDHLRATLPKLRQGIGAGSSTLTDQIEVCASYLAVMQVRMGERLRFNIDVPASLGSHPFSPLLLISLVENAIKHGVEPSADGGSVTIRALEVRNGDTRDLAVSVIDSGVGLSPGLGDGVGLANVRAQLIAQFGARGRFSISGRPEGGTIATLIVPFVEGTS
jgi:two-component sensor histidine kinase